MKIAIWSPLPPSTSGIADYVAETLGPLSKAADVEVVCEDPAAVDARWRQLVPVRPASDAPARDLDLYHIGNSPSHAYVYRAALARPGVTVLHDWNLHYLLLGETVQRNDPEPYLREMRRAHGAAGTLVGRQVARALGGEMLPALYPLNDRLLEDSLAVVALSRTVAGWISRRVPDRPVLHLPHHLALPLDPVPSRAEARRALGLPEDALIVTAPGLATAAKRLDVTIRAVAALRPRFASVRLVVAGGVDPRLPLSEWIHAAGLDAAAQVTGRLDLADFVRHLAAADIVIALRFPTFGEMSGALVRAMGVGRPVVVTAGTPPAEEMPEGTVVPVDPGLNEEAELRAVLARLLGDAGLRDELGSLARGHVLRSHDLAHTVASLAAFLDDVARRKAELAAAIRQDRAEPGTLLGYFKEEVRWAARDLGLAGVNLGLEELLAALADAPQSPSSGL